MLTMHVELWPFGDESEAKRLVTINIANLGKSEWGDYDYLWTIDEPTPLVGTPIKAEGVLMGYDRNASCVEMLAAVLDDYRKPKVVGLTEQDKATAQRLRIKSSPEVTRRWPY